MKKLFANFFLKIHNLPQSPVSHLPRPLQLVLPQILPAQFRGVPNVRDSCALNWNPPFPRCSCPGFPCIPGHTVNGQWLYIFISWPSETARIVAVKKYVNFKYISNINYFSRRRTKLFILIFLVLPIICWKDDRTTIQKKRTFNRIHRIVSMFFFLNIRTQPFG